MKYTRKQHIEWQSEEMELYIMNTYSVYKRMIAVFETMQRKGLEKNDPSALSRMKRLVYSCKRDYRSDTSTKFGMYPEAVTDCATSLLTGYPEWLSYQIKKEANQ